jgi:hypothetical protein
MNMNNPRFHHYLFAHRILPRFAFSLGMDFYQVLKEQKVFFLQRLWTLAAKGIGPGDHLPFSGFKIYFVKSPPFMGAVIVLPEPKNITEAHMVLFVTRMDRKYTGKKPSKSRYFTLEYGKDSKNTILCEWAGGRHFIYGTGPAAKVKDFWEAAIRI